MLQDKASRSQTGPQDQAGQQLHVSGVFIVILELALVIENTLPVLVVVQWLPACARGVGDRLIAAFSVTCILSALIPTPLGLASYFSGSWYGGSPTCTTYQVTSIWCNLSSLALLAYICVNCRFAVRRLVNLQLTLPTPSRTACRRPVLHNMSSPLEIEALPSTNVVSECDNVNSSQMLTSRPQSPTGRLEINSIHDQSNGVLEKEDENEVSNASSLLKMNGLCGIHNAPELDVTDHEVNSSRDNVCVSIENNSHLPKFETPQNNNENHQYQISNSTINKSEQKEIELANATDCQTNSNEITQPSSERPDSCNEFPSTRQQITMDQTTVSNSSNTKYNVLRNPLIYEDSTFIYTQSLNSQTNGDQTTSRAFRPRDYVSLVLFFLYSITLAISSLPVVGFGPQHRTNEKMCNSWLVPTPTSTKEKSFFILFLVFVYLCLLLGCASGAQVCLLVNQRLRQENKRTYRLYHEEENVPDIREFSILDDLKRHYSLACIVMSGILTWVPIVVMLTLQKSGVNVSEATLVYSNIATSLPGLLNPLLYSLVLVRYRDGYKAVFEKCCRKKAKNRQHPMKNVGNHRDCEDICEVTVTSSMDGHQTIHCRPNPSFDNLSHFTRDDEEDEDEDYFYEDQDDLIQQRTGPTLGKLSEKTPLHASVTAPSNQVSCAADVRSFHVSARQWPHSADQSNHWDKEYLLAHEISCQDDETGF